MRTSQYGFARCGAAFRLKTAGLAVAAFMIPADRVAAELPWVSIGNGTDLTGWQVPSPNPFWTVSGGVLAGQSNAAQAGSMLYTLASYQNFLLETDVRWSGEIDSGIMLRTPELQLQFGVSRSLNRDMTCSFYTGSYPLAGQTPSLPDPGPANDATRESKFLSDRGSSSSAELAGGDSLSAGSRFGSIGGFTQSAVFTSTPKTTGKRRLFSGSLHPCAPASNNCPL